GNFGASGGALTRERGCPCPPPERFESSVRGTPFPATLHRLSKPAASCGSGGSRDRNQAARSASVVKLSPQPHSPATFGLAKVNCSFSPAFRKSIVVPSTRARLSAS